MIHGGNYDNRHKFESTDGNFVIIMSYIRTYRRLKLFHNKNQQNIAMSALNNSVFSMSDYYAY